MNTAAKYCESCTSLFEEAKEFAQQIDCSLIIKVTCEQDRHEVVVTSLSGRPI